MNNLSAFTDVINSVQQAIVALNSQLIQMWSQQDEIKVSLTSFQTETESKVALLFADVNQLKQTVAEIETKLLNCICNCNSQTTTPNITEADVQQMIDKSIAQLLDGVTNQPLPSLVDVVNETNLNNLQEPLVVVEPPNITETVQDPVASQVPTPAKSKRSYKKKS